jgi:hypothetical protein
MERLTQLHAQLTAAASWVEDARAMLAKAASDAALLSGGGDGGEGAEAEGSGTAEGEEGAGVRDETAGAGEWALPPGAAGDEGVAALLQAVPELRGGGQPRVKKARRPSSRLPELSVIEQLLESYGTLLVRAEEEAQGEPFPLPALALHLCCRSLLVRRCGAQSLPEQSGAAVITRAATPARCHGLNPTTLSPLALSSLSSSLPLQACASFAPWLTAGSKRRGLFWSRSLLQVGVIVELRAGACCQWVAGIEAKCLGKVMLHACLPTI